MCKQGLLLTRAPENGPPRGEGERHRCRHDKVRAARGKGRGGNGRGSKSIRSCVLRVYIVGGMGVKNYILIGG